MSNVFEERIAALRRSLAEQGLDGLFITDIYNVSYFTGKKGNDCSLWITADKAFIITDFRYREMALSLTWLELFESYLSVPFTDVFKKTPDCVNVGVEKDSLSLAKYLDLEKALEGKKLVPTAGIVQELRKIKDEDELKCITEAEALGDEAFEYMLGVIKAGMTEAEVAAELEYYLRKHGASGLSFDTIAVSGPNSSYPHGVPGERKLQSGDFLTLDFGCIYKGYCSDMTRTVAIGKVTDEMKKVYDTVLKAQLSACEKIRAGLTGIECDALARDVIDAAGYGEYFGHSLGHGVGLQVHELPRFNKVWDKPIEPDTVVSIEPGIYLPGKFGVRIEDLAIIKENGIINLCRSSKQLIIL